MYPLLSAILLLTILATTAVAITALLKPKILKTHKRKLTLTAAIWLAIYATFLLFFTGPKPEDQHPPGEISPYKLPWRAGESRFVAQGNRSFTSHRGYHLYAWDFVMPTGTEILSVADGEVTDVIKSFDGIGYSANYVTIQHADGNSSVYAHIKNEGALVKVGDKVKQGQPIALSGMVGQAPFPHVHFYVINKERTTSIPISFNDVLGGIPEAGHFYTSGNERHEHSH